MPNNARLEQFEEALVRIKQDIETAANKIRIYENKVAQCQNDYIYTKGKYGVRPNNDTHLVLIV
jgi:hypothetical protein